MTDEVILVGGLRSTLGVTPVGEDRVDRADRLLDREIRRVRRAGVDLAVDDLGQVVLARRRREDPPGDLLDPGRQLHEPRVARLERPLLLLDRDEHVEVAQQRVRRLAKRVSCFHRVPSGARATHSMPVR